MSRSTSLLDTPENEQPVQAAKDSVSEPEQLCTATSPEDRQAQNRREIPSAVPHQAHAPQQGHLPADQAGSSSVQQLDLAGQPDRGPRPREAGQGRQEKLEPGSLRSQALSLFPRAPLQPGLPAAAVDARGPVPPVGTAGSAADVDPPASALQSGVAATDADAPATDGPEPPVQAQSSGPGLQAAFPSSGHRGGERDGPGTAVPNSATVAGDTGGKEAGPKASDGDSLDSSAGGAASASSLGESSKCSSRETFGCLDGYGSELSVFDGSESSAGDGSEFSVRDRGESCTGEGPESSVEEGPEQTESGMYRAVNLRREGRRRVASHPATGHKERDERPSRAGFSTPTATKQAGAAARGPANSQRKRKDANATVQTDVKKARSARQRGDPKFPLVPGFVQSPSETEGVARDTSSNCRTSASRPVGCAKEREASRSSLRCNSETHGKPDERGSLGAPGCSDDDATGDKETQGAGSSVRALPPASVPTRRAVSASYRQTGQISREAATASSPIRTTVATSSRRSRRKGFRERGGGGGGELQGRDSGKGGRKGSEQTSQVIGRFSELCSKTYSPPSAQDSGDSPSRPCRHSRRAVSSKETDNCNDDASVEIKKEIVDDDHLQCDSTGTPDDVSTDPAQNIVHPGLAKDSHQCGDRERSTDGNVLKNPDVNVQWRILFEASLPNAPQFSDVVSETHSDEDTKENISTNISRCPSADRRGEVTKLFKTEQKCKEEFDEGDDQNDNKKRESSTIGQSTQNSPTRDYKPAAAACKGLKESTAPGEPLGVGRRKQKTPRQLQQHVSEQPQSPDDRPGSELQRSAAGRRETPPVVDCNPNFACERSTVLQPARRQFVHIVTRSEPQAQKADHHPQAVNTAKDLPCGARETPQEPLVSRHQSPGSGTGSFVPEPERRPSTPVICSSEQSALALSAGKPSVSAAAETACEGVDSALKDGQTLTVKLGTNPASDDVVDGSNIRPISAEKPSYTVARAHPTKTKESSCNPLNAINANTDTALNLSRKPYRRSALEGLLTTNDRSDGNCTKASSFVDDHPLLQSRQRLVPERHLSVETCTNAERCNALPKTSLLPARSDCNSETSTAQVAQTLASLTEASDSSSAIGKTADSTLGIRFSNLLQSFSKRAEDEFTSARKIRADSPCEASSAPTAKFSGEGAIPILQALRSDVRHSDVRHPDKVIADGASAAWTTMNCREEDTRLSPGILNKSVKHIMSLKDRWAPKRLYKQRVSRNLQPKVQQCHGSSLPTTGVEGSLKQNIHPAQSKSAHIKHEMKGEHAPQARKSASPIANGTALSASSKTTEKAKEFEQLLQNSTQLLTKSNTQPCPVAPIPMVRIPYIPLPVYSAAFPGVIPALSQSKSNSSPPVPVMTSANQAGAQGHVQQPHYIPIVPKLPVVLPTLPSSIILDQNGSSAYGSPLAPAVSVPGQTPIPGGKQALASAYATIPPVFPGLAAPQTALGQGNGAAVSQIGIVPNQVFSENAGGSFPIILFLPSFAQSASQCSRPRSEQTATAASATTTTATAAAAAAAVAVKQEPPGRNKDAEDEAFAQTGGGVSLTYPKRVQSEERQSIASPTTGTAEASCPDDQDDVSTNPREREKPASSPVAVRDGVPQDVTRPSPLPVEEKGKSPVVLKSGRKRTASRRYDSHVDIDLSDASDYGNITPITSDEEWTPDKDDGQTSDDEQEAGRKSHRRDEFEDLFRPPRKKANGRSAGPWKKPRSEMQSHLKCSSASSLNADSRPKAERITAKHNLTDNTDRAPRDQARVGAKKTFAAETSQKRESDTEEDGKTRKRDTYSCSSNKLKTSPKSVPRKRRRVPYTEDELTCRFCSKMFINIYRLRRHEFSHGNERPYVCDVCGKAFKQSGHRNEHRLTHNANKRSFLCNICGVVIASRSSFRYHLLSHKQLLEGIVNTASSEIKSTAGDAETTPVTPGRDGRQTVGDASAATSAAASQFHKVPIDVNTGLAAYDCPHCLDRFATAQSLNCHLESHLEVEARCHVQPFVCTECGRSFTYRHNLEKHRACHVKPEKRTDSYQRKVQAAIAAGKPHFMCDTCGKVYLRKETLNKHHKTHLGLKPYLCAVCHKSFTQKIHLTVHSRLHTGCRPFQCRSCRSCFLDSTALARHVERDVCKAEGFITFNLGKRGTKPYHVLDDSLKAIVKRTKGRRQSKNANKLKCGLCSWTGRRKGFLARHIRRCHPHLTHEAQPDSHRVSTATDHTAVGDSSTRRSQADPEAADSQEAASTGSPSVTEKLASPSLLPSGDILPTTATLRSKGNKPSTAFLRSKDKPPSASLHTLDLTPTASLRSEDKAPTASLRSEDEFSTASLRSENKPPAACLNTLDLLPTASLRSEDKPPAASLRLEDRPPTASLRSEDKLPAASLRSQDKPPTASLRSQDKPPTVSLRSQDKPPTASLRSQDKPPTASLHTWNTQPTASLRSEDRPPAISRRSEDRPPTASLRSEKIESTASPWSDDKLLSTPLRVKGEGNYIRQHSEEKTPTALQRSVKESPSGCMKGNDSTVSASQRSECEASSVRQHSDHIEPTASASSSVRQHSEQIGPTASVSSSVRQHSDQIGPTASSSVRQHSNQIGPTASASSSVRQLSEQIGPTASVSSSVRQHSDQIGPTASSSVRQHSDQIGPTASASSSVRKHSEQMGPTASASSNVRQHSEQMGPTASASSSVRKHSEQMGPTASASSSVRQHSEQIGPTASASSSVRKHSEQMGPTASASSNVRQHSEQMGSTASASRHSEEEASGTTCTSQRSNETALSASTLQHLEVGHACTSQDSLKCMPTAPAASRLSEAGALSSLSWHSEENAPCVSTSQHSEGNSSAQHSEADAFTSQCSEERAPSTSASQRSEERAPSTSASQRSEERAPSTSASQRSEERAPSTSASQRSEERAPSTSASLRSKVGACALLQHSEVGECALQNSEVGECALQNSEENALTASTSHSQEKVQGCSPRFSASSATGNVATVDRMKRATYNRQVRATERDVTGHDEKVPWIRKKSIRTLFKEKLRK